MAPVVGFLVGEVLIYQSRREKFALKYFLFIDANYNQEKGCKILQLFFVEKFVPRNGQPELFSNFSKTSEHKQLVVRDTGKWFNSYWSKIMKISKISVLDLNGIKVSSCQPSRGKCSCQIIPIFLVIGTTDTNLHLASSIPFLDLASKIAATSQPLSFV